MKALLAWLLELLQRIFAPPPAPPAPPPSSPWDTCIAWVLRCEGGFVDDPRDPQGATNMGITIGTLSRWQGHPATVDEVRNLTQQTAEAIYYRDYWHASRCDEMPPGVDLLMIDCLVMSNPERAHKWLQHAVGVPEDGVLGPHTMAALKQTDPELIIQAMTAQRLQYYQSLPTWGAFGNGWTNRLRATKLQAMDMITHAAA